MRLPLRTPPQFSGSITSYTGSGFQVQVSTNSIVGLYNGAQVTIVGTGNIDGNWTVSSVSAGQFTIGSSFPDSGLGGTWKKV